LAPHPEFQLTDSDGNKAPRNLDVSNPAAVQYAHELIEEYLPLFPARYWHSGGEEYLPSQDYSKYPQLQSHARARYGANANATDAVLGFINDTIDLVHGNGKTGRIWHDGLSGGSAVTVNKNIVVEWWTDFNPLGNLTPPNAQQLLDQGYTISNASYWPLYYTVGAAAGFPPGLPPRPDLCSFYQGWSVNMFVGPLNLPAVACNTVHVLPPTMIAEDEPRNLGSKILEWNDGADAETQDQIAQGIAPRLRILAQKTWNSPLLVQRYEDFQTVMDAVGHAPGYSQ
jgi:hexosaminidase